MCVFLAHLCLVGFTQTGPNQYNLDYLTTDKEIISVVINTQNSNFKPQDL